MVRVMYLSQCNLSFSCLENLNLYLIETVFLSEQAKAFLICTVDFAALELSYKTYFPLLNIVLTMAKYSF